MVFPLALAGLPKELIVFGMALRLSAKGVPVIMSFPDFLIASERGPNSFLAERSMALLGMKPDLMLAAISWRASGRIMASTRQSNR